MEVPQVFSTSDPENHPSYDAQLNMCVDPVGKPSGYHNLVSACLFVFYGRGNTLRHYTTLFKKYTHGLELTLSNLQKVLPGWGYRLYIDHSLYVHRTNAALSTGKEEDPLSLVMNLYEKYSGLLEIVAVRCLDIKHFPYGQTFMPSMWRYLVAFDQGVDAFICADADNQISPIYAAYTREWLGKSPGKKLMFIIPSDYHPIQCTVTVLFKNKQGIVGCPIAQMWGGRQTSSEPTILPKSLWTAMVAVITDPDLRKYGELFINTVESIEKIINTSPKYIEIRKKMLLSDKPVDLFDDLVTILHDELGKLKGDVSNSATLEIVDLFIARPDILRMHILREMRVLWNFFDESIIKVNIENDEKIDSILANANYGVDEFILHMILEYAKQSGDLCLYSTPTVDHCGIDFHPNVSPSRDDSIPKFLQRMVKIPIENRSNQRSVIDVELKTYILMFILSHHAPIVKDEYEKWKKIYVTRAYKLQEQNYNYVDLDVDKFMKLSEESYREDRQLYHKLVKRMLYIKDDRIAKKLIPGVSFNSGAQSMFIHTIDGFHSLLRLFVDALFSTVNDMHSFKGNLPEEVWTAPWWDMDRKL
jgi:hypothetical protein